MALEKIKKMHLFRVKHQKQSAAGNENSLHQIHLWFELKKISVKIYKYCGQ